MWLKYEELFPVTVTDASSHCSRQWKAFIYVLNGSSFNDTWMLRFLGDFFVIPDKFIILTIKLIKHSAHSNSFLREEIFWCHRNPSSAVSQAVPCPGSVSLLTRGGGKKQLWDAIQGAHRNRNPWFWEQQILFAWLGVWYRAAAAAQLEVSVVLQEGVGAEGCSWLSPTAAPRPPDSTAAVWG